MRRSITFVILSLCMALFGCATEAQEAPVNEAVAEVEAGGAEEAFLLEESAMALALDDSPSTSANCSVVQYCNAPGNDGSVCKQLGCSTSAALLECFNEVRNVCGSHTCPLIFVDLNGRRANQCATGCGLDSKALIPCSAPADAAVLQVL